MPTQELEIELITIDQAMQQRGGISDDTVAQYAEAMQAGDIFPPIEIVQDAEYFWVFDGFHRVKAAQKAWLKTISANIRQGSKRDAEYLSFSSNARHGLPRPRGSLKRILVKILTDPEWSKTPLRQIAKHVDCNEKYVRITRDELVADCPQPLQRAEKITVKTCDGKEYTRPAIRKDRPAKTVSDLTRIITQLSEIDTNNKAAEKKIIGGSKTYRNSQNFNKGIEETKHKYKDINFTAKTLSLIKEIDGIVIDYQRQGYEITLRQLYYQLVAKNIITNKQSEYKRVGKIAGEARKAGLLDWNIIIDRTRHISQFNHWQDPGEIIRYFSHSYHIDTRIDQPTYIEIWSEKDALASVLEPICDAGRRQLFHLCIPTRFEFQFPCE